MMVYENEIDKTYPFHALWLGGILNKLLHYCTHRNDIIEGVFWTMSGSLVASLYVFMYDIKTLVPLVVEAQSKSDF